MKKVMCSSGHYYDADKHGVCPFCGSMESDAKGFKTLASDNAYGDINRDISNIQQRMTAENKIGGMYHSGGEQGTQPLDADVSMNAKNFSGTVALDSDANQIKQSGATVALDSISVDANTVRVPVVGWLACTAGPAKGKSYELLSNGNKIGRNIGCNVNIKEDLSVSKEVCAEIVYDSEENCFYITPGTTNGKSRKNGEIVLQPCALDNFDTIKIGKTELVFVALCTERFRWENKIEE